ncbi:MAG: phosphoribosylanthranilate isomerase [Rickettsiales bacterium]|nr:phosphoribosylanthranilate isomerase [Rickettsiales bacterium]
MKVKICGIKDKETALFATSKGADFLGFVFFEKSPRNISIDKAIEIKNSLINSFPCKRESSYMDSRIRGNENFDKSKIEIPKIVAVLVDADDNFLHELQKLNPDYIQLHGSETPAKSREIKEKYNFNIIKAISISEEKDLEKAKEFSNIADYILFDAKPPKTSVLPGGNAISFDWKILKNFNPSYKWFLSGGLNSENISEALSLANPYGLDVSSGVESSAGVKDFTKIEKFLQNSKNI